MNKKELPRLRQIPVGERALSNHNSKSKYSTKIIVIVSLLMFIGLFSYAFFSYIESGNKNQTLSLKSGTMALRFADNDNGINASLHFGETVTKKFIIENTGTLESSLSLDWFNLVNTYQNRSLSYNLTYSETEDGEYELIVPETNMPTSNIPITSTLSSEISVPAGETYYFNLNVTLNNLSDVEQSNDLNATFTTSFNVAEPSKYRYYTLTVDPNNGTWNTFTAPQEYQMMNKDEMNISNPTRYGYTFSRWTLQGESSTLEDTTFTMGISNTLLKAEWTPKKVNITVDGENREVDFGTEIDLGNPNKEGYTFTGYEVTGGKIENNTLTITSEDGITVKKTYKVNNYKYIVYHNQMNTDGIGYTLVSADTDEGEAAYNTTITPDVKNYKGFTSPSTKDLIIQVESVYPPVKNKIDYNYARDKYTITLDIDGTTTTEEMYYGSSKDLGVPTKTGYDFTNWSVTGGTIKGNIFTITEPNPTASANFTPKKLSVTFNANGGEVETESKIVTYDSTYGELPEPTYSGMEFLGWFTEQNGGIEITASTKVEIPSNVILYAHWQRLSLVEKIIAEANPLSVSSYDSGNKTAAYTFEHGATDQTPGLTDYRFIGYNPNNYIEFNNEMWRIIGVFPVKNSDGAYVNSLKIVREESVNGKNLFDDYGNDIVDNQIASQTLNILADLNNDYYNNQGTYETVGLSTTARSQTINTTWYLGVPGTKSSSEEYYIAERNSTNGVSTIDGNENRTNSDQNVGLFYLSDYIYTFALGVNDTCYTNSRCSAENAIKSWILRDIVNYEAYAWSLTPMDTGKFGHYLTRASYHKNSTAAYNSSFYLGSYFYQVFPTVQLEPDISSISGDGSKDNPYILKTEKVTQTILFDANGGTTTAKEKTVTTGESFGPLPVPFRDNYDFDGWYTEIDGGTKITKNMTVDLPPNQTLYAHWKVASPVMIQANYEEENIWSYKEDVKNIFFENKISGKSNAKYTFDISENKNKSVMGYLVTNSADSTKYDLYIQANGKVLANPHSNYAFAEFTSLENISGFENYDTSKVVSMKYMFSGNGNLTTLDLSSFDTSNVTDMGNMFSDCMNLTTLNISNFNTSQVVFMDHMFYECMNLTTLDLRNFDTSNVINMYAMFSDCSSLTTLNVSSFNTSKVANMSSMFSSCMSLTTLNVSNFDTSNVTNMYCMFSYCMNLTALNLSNFNTSKVVDMDSMFIYCEKLTTLNISKFNVENVTTYSQIFYGLNSSIKITVQNTTLRTWAIDASTNPKFTTSNFVIG